MVPPGAAPPPIAASDGAVAAPPAQPPADGAVAPAPRIALADSDAGLASPANKFNFVYLRDLWVEVDVGQLPATALLELTFVGPDGSVFKKVHANFTTAPDAVATRELLVARPTANGWALVLPVAVGGTSFMRLPLPGRWQLSAHVTGGITPDVTTAFEALVQR